ncbi:MAG: site-specific integrase [Bacteroidales bacterium]
MTSVKAVLHIGHATKSGKYPLVVQIIHNRQRRLLKTGIRLLPEQFIEAKQKIIKGVRRSQSLELVKQENETLKALLTVVKNRVDELSDISFTADDISEWYKMRDIETYLFNYLDKMIDEKLSENKIGIARAYKSTLNSIRAYRNNEDMHLSDLTFAFLTEYEHYLIMKGVSQNTIAFYFRNLRTAYNKAYSEGVFQTIGHSPFAKFNLSAAKTMKRALPIKFIRKLSALDLSVYPNEQLARDLFMASFYLRGMAFVDLIHLRRENVINGSISYSRRKTGMLVLVEIVPPLQVILNRYAKCGNYLFPCLSDECKTAEEQYSKYRKSLLYYNRFLKSVGTHIGLRTPLTGYVARHSWATCAKNIGASTTVISEGLGHASEKVTRVYLKSFENSVLDDLNNVVSKLR